MNSKFLSKPIVWLVVILCFQINISQAKKVRVLFLGNSYTAVNNLPEVTKQMALSTGDTLEYSANTPGGYTLQGHSTNATSLSLIQSGNWDYVVLQEQSQLPSFPDSEVATQVYPYAKILDSIIHVYNPCATTLFYMTWGRKNGDASNCQYFPPLCTYEGMDSLLQLRYTIMAQDNHAALSPVAKVWHTIRDNYPNIELYASDESHPSAMGTFATACSFYSVIFGKDPSLAPYTYTINTVDAANIAGVAKAVVFDSLSQWFQYVVQTNAAFIADSTAPNTLSFTNQSNNANAYLWNFGDGTFSTDDNPTHTYANAGNYTIQLIAYDSICNSKADTITKDITINSATGIGNVDANNTVKIYPIPADNYLQIEAKDWISNFSIFDVQGRKIAQGVPPLGYKKGFKINTTALNTGIYFLHLTYKNGNNIVIKLLKK